ncbi:MAG: lytic transglycosylase domain-containing protein [Burkholderiales bacterium]|jgi:type IV secretion system protein VirB1|nr:lytic transglycosylase domain-containing protein [Burkholderiales bacterium]
MILDVILLSCSIKVAQNTMKAIIKTESRGNYLVIGLNTKKHHYIMPKDINSAIAIVNFLEQNNYNFDIGLTQINIKNVHKLGYMAQDMLNPCLNVFIASEILHKYYIKALNNSATNKEALYKAISAYNTGSFSAGITNGYVAKVISNAQ